MLRLTRVKTATRFNGQFEVRALGPGGAALAAVVIIPARLGSTRFPRKVLASRTGKPLVQHVVDQVRRCQRVRDVIVATDHPEVAEVLGRLGTSCVMTSEAHQSGTDRVAEVVLRLPADISAVVNVQGDEPEIEPGVVDGLVDVLEGSNCDMATAVTPFPAGQDVANPNLVKAVLTEDGRAAYFSRSPVPYHRDLPAGATPQYWLHVGIYAYRRDFLLEFAGWKPTHLEMTEKLEQLRAIEHGRTIRAVRVARAAHGIDTPEQYEAFVDRLNALRKTNSPVSSAGC
jgi:3-deoxy-manno-octulosonate cytidylyltransferase (CMP-KDO synthetase)